MKILIGVHQFFPHYYTGTERYVLNLAHGLQDLGHHVHVMTYVYPENRGDRLGSCGELYTEEYVFEGIPVTSFSHEYTAEVDFGIRTERFDREARQLMEQGGFDVYHCAHPLRIGGSLRVAKDLGIPTVLMLTDYWLLCPRINLLRPDDTRCEGPRGGENCRAHCYPEKSPSDFQARAEAARRLVAAADVVLSPSLFLIGVFRFNRFPGADRIRLARHGFDYGRIGKEYRRKPPGETIVVGYIGTLHHHKGVHVLIEAFKKARAPKLRLEIRGDPEHVPPYAASVAELAREDSRIRFRGAYRHEDLTQVMEQIDLVVVPSVWYENAPLTVSTALAFGVPVVVSNIGGMAEMVREGRDGFRFPVGDAEQLAGIIERIAADPTRLANLETGLSRPRRIEDEAFDMERLYRAIVDRPDQSPSPE